MINPTLPSGYYMSTSGEGPAIQCDGTYIYFYGSQSAGSGAIFRCSLNGQNVIKLTTESPILKNFNIY